jgi:hypothetical protein
MPRKKGGAGVGGGKGLTEAARAFYKTSGRGGGGRGNRRRCPAESDGIARAPLFGRAISGDPRRREWK